MSRVDESSRIQQLRRALTKADEAAFLVESRVIRRVIRERFAFANPSASIPHPESQVVPSLDVRHLAHPDELGLQTFSDLPPQCLLICQPEEGELEHWPLQELLQQVWRRLFHAQIDRDLLNLQSLRRADIQERIAQIGQVEFDEAHFVLRSEHRLVDPESRTEAWREFVAIYLEMQRFEPDLLPVWFPSIAGRAHVAAALARDLNADAVFARTRLDQTAQPDVTPHAVRDEARLVSTRRDWSLGIGITQSDRSYLRQLRRRDKANERGNTVAAAVCAIRATQCATSDEKRGAAQEKARVDVHNLVERLRRALEFAAEDTDEWQSSLWELAMNSVHGFWNSEKRLLFDLQKVCLDHERVTYRVDLVKWIVSRGRRPLRRPLNNLREVMMAKHLASSAVRLVDVRLSGVDRERLTGLLNSAARLAETQMRQRTRPVLRRTLEEVELLPRNVPERVAFDKLIEDSLDCIADRGYLTMGYLRDAISKNDLKLPDLKELRELFRGDLLLRADDRLDVALDGVYRRGDFYLRWLQAISSVFFGTPLGRFATLFVLIPFGGAVVIVEGVLHIVKLVKGEPTRSTGSNLQAADRDSDPAATSLETIDTTDSETTTLDAASAGSRSTDTAGEDAVIAAESPSGPSETPPEISSSGTPEIPTDTTNLTSTDAVESTTAEPKPSATDSPSGVTVSVPNTAAKELIAVRPKNTDDAVDQILNRQLETVSWVLIVGFLLMGLIHVVSFRHWFLQCVAAAWRLAKKLLISVPLKIIRLPAVQRVWKNWTVVRFRRIVVLPGLVSFVGVRLLPWLVTGVMLSWWWVGSITVLFSMALNSRLGQDAQELTAEWVGNTWYQLRARVVMALIDWVIDLFRTILNFIERFLYAVDEWLRFHSDESWMSVVLKACLGVIWSFFSFLIRIYVNLLIEPTLHPVKHFPVVTVAHKMFLPMIELVGRFMLKLFTPYMGLALAGLFTGFNIFFLPGIFGFLVWELKENWRLYQANRKDLLTPVAVGSHGETVARLLRPGFHSGTLPKLFRRLRRLEHQQASFRRFSARRAGRQKLEQIEQAVRSFADRELIRLLTLCPVWKDFGLQSGHIHTASNSFSIDLVCNRLGDLPVKLLFQEQSGWVAASIPQTGWLRSASSDQLRSLQNALAGFYRKSGIDMVREQIENNFIGRHEYDINSEGFAIWPNGMFSHELTVDLNRKGTIRPIPAGDAAAAGLLPVERETVVFSDSITSWKSWEKLWTPFDVLNPDQSLPPACTEPPQLPVLHPIR